jgi:hypothetical protein
MLDNSAQKTDQLATNSRTQPDWMALEKAVEELLDILGASHLTEENEASDHLVHLQKFDWTTALHQRSPILRRR